MLRPRPAPSRRWSSWPPFRLTSHAAAWRGEVNRSRCAWASSGRASNSAISVRQRASSRPNRPDGWAPTSARVGRWSVPHRRGGSTTAEATGPGRGAARPAVDSPARPRCRRADRPPARRCRAPSNTHRELPHRSRPRPGWRSQGLVVTEGVAFEVSCAQLSRARGRGWSSRCRHSRSRRSARGSVRWVRDERRHRRRATRRWRCRQDPAGRPGCRDPGRNRWTALMDP